MNKPKINQDILLVIGPLLQRLAWSDRQTKAEIQKYGVNLLPINFYSNIPSIEEIESSYEYSQEQPPYLVPTIFDERRFRETLEQLCVYSTEFDPPIDGDEESCQDFFWGNGMFSYSDAMSYYCFIRHIQPANIIEIGSGFSTLVALQAVQKNGFGTIHCIEPYPRKFLWENDQIDLHALKAQDIDSDFLNSLLQDNDILFIDSTHTVKTGSDCLHIYLRLLPAVKRNIFVHVHDVFLPYGLPKEWLLDLQRFWTEQYLLLAFLLDNPKTMPLYGSNYNAKWNTPLMEKWMGAKYPSGGGSFWFKYNGSIFIDTEVRE
ncbi:MAG: class I SAM-dependent methyltransferase [Chloroflexota bacterium]